MYYAVIDGYALAHRAKHAYPELKNDNGRPCQVTVGFFRQWLSIAQKPELKGCQPVFVFDGPHNFRKTLDSDYKSNRTASSDDFYAQVDEIIKLCRMIAPTYQAEGYEGDDLAGSFVNMMHPEDTAMLVTVDCDWLQLLSPSVRMYQLRTDGKHVLWTRELFFQKYEGLLPSQLIDVKAITGDGSDNIPGIKGIGWVTVNKLLQEFLSVDGIYQNIYKVTNKGKVQEKLIANQERVYLNRNLATIRKDVPIDAPVLPDVSSAGEYIDYLLEELQAQQLANLMGIYLQMQREVGV